MSLATAQHFDAIALHIVKPEIDASLLQVQNALSAYIDDTSNTFGLAEASENMRQIHGVLSLLEIAGAIELAQATSQLINHIVADTTKVTDQQLGAVSEGLMMLSRYLEFVVLRENLLPHFLLPSINRIYAELDQPLLREGYFLQPYLSIIQLPNLNLNLQKPEISPAQVNQLLALYKTSLNHLLKKQANALDFQAIKLVGHFTSMLAAGSSSELYWHAINTAFTDLQSCGLNAVRLRSLILIERNLQKFVTNTAVFVPTEQDIADALTLSACRDHEEADELRQQLGLNDYLISDAQASLLGRYLHGPDSATIHVTTELMQQEISDIKNKIDSMQHGDSIDSSFSAIGEQLHQLANTLSLLNLGDAGTLLSYQANQISSWRDMTNIEEINNLMDALLYAGNALTVLDRSYIAGTSKLPFHNLHISLHQLEEAGETLVKESRESLNMSMRALTSYLETKDLLHMNNVPAMFETIAGALAFMDATAGRDMLKQAAQYVERAFAPDQTTPPDSHHINLLANVMVSVEHYLESLEQQKPLGIRPFEIGLKSVQELAA
ncbi:MAG: hypothetical protein EOO69_09600 [Moraxellaceae bacterium]|nr:MAG: hypothetical protein EOO69_09600 [Moraxellaceae bacterium]